MELKIEEKKNPSIVILNDTLPNKNNIKKSSVSSYDDILSKMGMCVENGKITLIHSTSNTNPLPYKAVPKMECSKVKCSRLKESLKNNFIPIPSPSPSPSPSPLISDNQNSYIYNKYFKNQSIKQEQDQEPLTNEKLLEKLIQMKIQRLRLKQIKSTKLIMPTENIQFAPENNFNQLFYQRK